MMILSSSVPIRLQFGTPGHTAIVCKSGTLKTQVSCTVLPKTLESRQLLIEAGLAPPFLSNLSSKTKSRMKECAHDDWIEWIERNR